MMFADTAFEPAVKVRENGHYKRPLQRSPIRVNVRPRVRVRNKGHYKRPLQPWQA
jgi:hypothetical protein